MPNNLSALLFCASKSPDQKTLSSVEQERKALKDIFLKLDQGNRLNLVEENDYTSKDLSQRIALVKNQQVLLHIGGHANGEAVLGADGTSYVNGICKTIKLSEIDLVLAFINGCSSLQQAEQYFQIGAKVIIVTNSDIVDEHAKAFAEHFYECLSGRDSIEQAFEKASAHLTTLVPYTYNKIDELKIATRGSRSKGNDDDKKLPWRLVYQEENHGYLGWKIPLVSERLTPFPDNTALEVIGRETEIKELHYLLENKNRVSVKGLAGMGKSTLAKAYLRQYESEYKYIIWIDQNGIFKSSLAGHADLCEKLKLSFTEKTLEERYGILIKELNERGDPNYPSLLVVDNAEADLNDPDIVLPESRTWKILATSRQTITNFVELKLDKLQPDKARELFLKHCPIKGEDDLKVIDQIVRHIDYHPLAIECSAKSIFTEWDTNLEEFLENLKNFKLDNQEGSFDSGYAGQEKNLIQNLLAIFNRFLFNEEEKKLLIQLALMPTIDLPFSHLKVLLDGIPELKKYLTKLEDQGWISKVIQTNGKKSIRLHRLIQEVIKYQFSKDKETDTYDIRLLWEPANQVIQNLIHNLEHKNTSTDFELLIYYFEIKRVFSKDGALDNELNTLRIKWGEAFFKLMASLKSLPQKEFLFFEHLSENYPEDSYGHFIMGYYFSFQKKWDKAITAYQKAIDLGLISPIIYNNLGAVLEAKGKVDQAILAYKKSIELDPKLAHSYYNLGEALKHNGELEKAIVAYQKTIEVDPKFEIAYISLGKALSYTGDLVQTVAAFQKAIELNPKDASTYNYLGDALADQGELDQAIDAYQIAIEFDPLRANAHFNLAIALKRKGELDQAIDAIQKVVELDPKDVAAVYNLGTMAFEKGKYDLAITALQKAIEINPNDASTYCNLGIALEAKGNLDQATEAFQKAIEIDPKYVSAFHNLANVLLEKGEWDNVIATCKLAIQLNTKDVAAHFLLGGALHVIGEYDNAILVYQKIIEIDPVQAEAYYLLGRALYDKGEFGQARAAYQKAIELDPEYADIYYKLGSE